MNPRIAIMLGSDSDYPYFEKAVARMKAMGVGFTVQVSSAHRTPERTVALVREFESQGVRVIIAAAGGAAHLPGVVAAHTVLPVLGVPIPSALQGGLDSLYSMVQMPGGIPVATFGIGESGAVNAVLFALQMVALEDGAVKEGLTAFRRAQQDEVLAKNRRLQEKIGQE